MYENTLKDVIEAAQAILDELDSVEPDDETIRAAAEEIVERTQDCLDEADDDEDDEGDDEDGEEDEDDEEDEDEDADDA